MTCQAALVGAWATWHSVDGSGWRCEFCPSWAGAGVSGWEGGAAALALALCCHSTMHAEALTRISGGSLTALPRPGV